MSLLLCRQEPVKHPYFVESLGIHLYSSQELCYVIYHYPLLVMDDFVDDNLIAFIRRQLDMEFLASKLEKWLRSRESQDELLCVILSECDYYDASEVHKYRQTLAAYRKLHPADFDKAKADDNFKRKQYGKAIAGYEKVLEYPRDKFVNDRFFGTVWNNLGASYARMFQFEKAAGCFCKSYFYEKDEKILERLYDLTVFCSRIELDSTIQKEMTDGRKARWDKSIEEARELASASKEVMKLEGMFQQDPIKRMEGAAAMVKEWKQEYRSMV